METENTMVDSSTEDTGASVDTQTKAQVEQEKMFSQEELDNILSKRLAQVTKKYADVDLDEYKQLKSLQQQVEEEQLIKRNEFDKVLQKTKQANAQEVNNLRSELEKIKVDGALISAASNAKSVNPEHVSQLLRNNVRLGEDGSVTVIDKDGNARFNDKTAEPYSVAELVDEFLGHNPYFRVAGPSGAGSTSNTDTRSNKILGLADLDLTKASDRQIYKQMKSEGRV